MSEATMPTDPRLGVSINDETGYPCPKDGTVLALVEGGAWCPKCHTVWRQVDEVELDDLDALSEAPDA
jgi:hypothetical protein